MKKLIALFAFAGLLVVSCIKSEVSLNENQKGTYEFTLRASVDEMTKTAYAGDGTFSWSDGDQISVLFNDGAGNNKFYTLTAATGGAASATFTGTIDDGWVLGASDTGKEWALFPANGEHSYDTGTSLPLFKIANETDFTASHFSANIPMAAEGDGAGNFAFKHLTGVYKFTFTDVDASKVKFIVTNSARPLSGTIPVKVTGSTTNYLNYTATGAVGSSTITFIENVVSKTATFYVPYQSWRSDFQPSIMLINMDEGANKNKIILEKAAGAALEEANLAKMHVLPSKSAPGVGIPYAFASKFGVDWSAVTVSAPGSPTDGFDGISVVKATADATNIYVYFEMTTARLLADPSYKYANTVKLYLGQALNEEGFWMWLPKRTGVADIWIGWLQRYGEPCNNSSKYKTAIWGDTFYCEFKYARENQTFLQTDPKAYIGITSYYGKYNDGSADQTLHSNYMYAPAQDSGYLEVDLPAYSS